MRWWLLLAVLPGLLLPAPVRAHADDGLWFLEDPARDQRYVPHTFAEAMTDGALPRGDMPVPIPVTDLRRVTIGAEDQVGFNLDIHVERLTVGNLEAFPAPFCPTRGAHTGAGEAKFEAHFTLGGESEYVAMLLLDGTWEGPNLEELRITSFIGCLIKIEDGVERGPPQEIDVTLDDAGERIHLWIPKASLIGGNRAPPETGYLFPNADSWPQRVREGEVLSKVAVVSHAELRRLGFDWITTPAYVVQDHVDRSDSPEYRFQHPMANGVLMLRIEEGQDQMPVRPDYNQTVEVRLSNWADLKRIGSFEYVLDGPSDRVGHYRIYGPSRATVPPGESRVLQLALEVGPEARAGDNVTLRITVRSVGFPEVGFAEARLVPGPHVGPDADTLYLHGARYCPDSTESGVYESVSPGACNYPFLSSSRDDPLGRAQDRVRGSCIPDNFVPSNWRCVGGAGTLGIGTSSRVLFNETRPVRLDLVLEPGFQASDGVFKSQLYAVNSTSSATLAEWDQPVSFETPRTVLAFEAPLKKFARIWPRGTSFAWYFEVQFPAIGPAVQGYASTGFEVLTKESKLTLPLLDPPRPARSFALDHPLQLAALGPQEEFVNPGKSRLFNVTVFNQGGRAYDADLAATVDRAGWGVEVLPGDRFHLQPGDTVRLGVLVRAPQDEPDGTSAMVTVNVTDGQGRYSSIRLEAVVVAAIELADDTGQYVEDTEARDKLLATPGRETPAPGLSFLLLATIACAWARRAWTRTRPRR